MHGVTFSSSNFLSLAASRTSSFPISLYRRHILRKQHKSNPMVAGMSKPMSMAVAATRTNAKNSGLYPPLEPYETGTLTVSDVHELYYELSGNPQATTVVFLHGGPGGSTRPDHRRFFDPKAYRILLFDQRGCGRSLPHASTEDNTTQALISDMEKLRVHIGAENWGVFGGSWGSTLGLAYIQTHPARARFAVLRGIFLGRNTEIDWLYERAGAANLFPHEFDAYLGGLPKEKLSSADSSSILKTYHELLTADADTISDEERSRVAMAFCNWEGALSNFPGRPVLRRGYNPPASGGPKAAALAVGRLETHYFVNKCFFENDGELLEEERMQQARKVPAAIVHGRWDMVCPVKSAYDLAAAWPEASFQVINGAGHSAFEDGTRQALVKITDSFRNQDGRFRNPGKYYFLKLGKEVVDELNSRTTAEGISLTREALIVTDLAPSIDSIWKVSQLTRELPEIVNKNLFYFYGLDPNESN